MATLTIRNLSESTKRKIRISAARQGHSMEAEARNILMRAFTSPKGESKAEIDATLDQLVGVWKGKSTTDQLMQQTRGDD